MSLNNRIITQGLGYKINTSTKIVTLGFGSYIRVTVYVDSLSKITNLKRSVEKYIYDNIYTVSGYMVDFEGMPFDNTGINYWLQPRINDIKRTYYRSVSSNDEFGHEIYYNLIFRIFVNKSGTTKTHQHYLLRDKVVSYFKIGQVIGLYNYVGDSVLLAYMKVRDIKDDFPIAETQNLYGWQVSFDIAYVEEISD